MHTTQSKGFWSNRTEIKRQYGILVPGHTYRVVKPFQDFDRHSHLPDETWIFLGYSFLPYDDGLSLFVSSLDGEQEWSIRMQLRAEEQQDIMQCFDKYVELS